MKLTELELTNRTLTRIVLLLASFVVVVFGSMLISNMITNEETLVSTEVSLSINQTITKEIYILEGHDYDLVVKYTIVFEDTGYVLNFNHRYTLINTTIDKFYYEDYVIQYSGATDTYSLLSYLDD